MHYILKRVKWFGHFTWLPPDSILQKIFRLTIVGNKGSNHAYKRWKEEITETPNIPYLIWSKSWRSIKMLICPLSTEKHMRKVTRQGRHFIHSSECCCLESQSEDGLLSVQDICLECQWYPGLNSSLTFLRIHSKAWVQCC